MELRSGSDSRDALPPAGHGVDDGGAEAQLWARCRSGDDGARQELMARHMPYARIVAASYYSKRVTDEIEFADYLQFATVGLIECVDRYDPGVGVQFRSFASRRMHGAVLDGIEHMTERHQQVAARKRLEQQRVESIKEGLGEATTTRERTTEQLLAYVADAGLAFAIAWLLDGSGMVQAEDKVQTIPFYRSLEIKQLRDRIAELVESLPAQERRVVREHYFQERPFQDIAETMRLTKGRISQIHHRALRRLRHDLGKPGDCDVAW